MDGRQFDRYTKRLAMPSTRRALTTLAGGMLGAGLTLRDLDAAAAKRCKKPQQRCKKRSQCCAKKKLTCGFSHGGGTAKKTCCGKAGAACRGNALDCCIPLLCNANNTCTER